MIAITVILAAVVATLVMDFGDSTGPGPSANFDVEQSGNDSVVTLSSANRLDSWGAACDARPGSLSQNGSVGQSVTIGCDPGNVTIVGGYEGEESVMPH